MAPKKDAKSAGGSKDKAKNAKASADSGDKGKNVNIFFIIEFD